MNEPEPLVANCAEQFAPRRSFRRRFDQAVSDREQSADGVSLKCRPDAAKVAT